MMQFKIRGITDARSLSPYIEQQSGWVTRNEDRNEMEVDTIRKFIFGLARTLKDNRVRDFKLEDSPFILGQTRAFWRWLDNRYRRLVQIRHTKKFNDTSDSNQTTNNNQQGNLKGDNDMEKGDTSLNEFLSRADRVFESKELPKNDRGALAGANSGSKTSEYLKDEEKDTRSSFQRIQDMNATEFVPKEEEKLEETPSAIPVGQKSVAGSLGEKKAVEAIDELESIQKAEPATKTDPYHAGLANGLATAKACLTGKEAKLVRSPKQSLSEKVDGVWEELKEDVYIPQQPQKIDTSDAREDLVDVLKDYYGKDLYWNKEELDRLGMITTLTQHHKCTYKEAEKAVASFLGNQELSETKTRQAGALQRGDIWIDPRGRQFYVHNRRHKQRAAGVEIFGCTLEDLQAGEIGPKQMVTWTIRNSSDPAVIKGTVSPQLQKRFEAADRDYRDKKYAREQEQMKSISWKSDPKSFRGYATVKARDGKEYKSGDIVDVAWDNGTSPALLGNLDGTLYNQSGEVAVMDCRGIMWGKAKARFLAPKYIVGKSRSDYNAAELLSKARENKGQQKARRRSRGSFGLWN